MKGKRTHREVIQSLPPNIVNAQPDVVSEVSDRWFKELLELRSKRLHVSPEQAANIDTYRAHFQESIEQLAALAGVTPEAYLEDFARRIGQSTYPTAECLTPNDVLAFAETGVTGKTHQNHLSSCTSCKTLLAASLPPKDGFERIRDELRHLAPVQPEAPPPQPQAAYERGPQWAPLARFTQAVFLRAAVLAALAALVAPLFLKPHSWLSPQNQLAGLLGTIFVLAAVRLFTARKQLSQWDLKKAIKQLVPAGAVLGAFLAIQVAMTLYVSTNVNSEVASLSSSWTTLSMADNVKIPLPDGVLKLPSSILSYADAFRRQDRAATLNAAALLAGNDESYDKGIQLVTWAIGTKSQDPEFFNTRGILYYQKSRYQDAFHDFERAKSLLDSSEESPSFRGVVLGNTALAAWNLGLLDSAKDNFDASFEALPPGSAEKLHYLVGLGQLLLDSGRAHEADRKLADALQLAQSLHDESGEADVHRSIAEVSHFLGNTSDAVAQVKLALQGHDNDVDKAIDLGDLARFEFDLGLPSEALKHADQSLSLSRSAKYQKGIAEQLLLKGRIARRPDEATADYDQALSIFSSLGYSRGQAEVYRTLGSLQHEAAMQKLKEGETLEELKRHRSDFEAAKEYYEKALGLFQASGFPQGVVLAYGGIGTTLAFIYPDKPELAIQNFQQALDLADKIQYPLGRGNELANLGLMYKRYAILGPISNSKESLDFAEANLEEALRIHRSIGFKLGEGKQLMNLADVARLRGRSYCGEAKNRIAGSISVFRDIGADDLLNRATDASKYIDRACSVGSNNTSSEPQPQ